MLKLILLLLTGALTCAAAPADLVTIDQAVGEAVEHNLGLQLFGVSDDRPVIVSVVDTEAKLREVLPEVRAMVKEGLVVLLDAERVPLDGDAG